MFIVPSLQLLLFLFCRKHGFAQATLPSLLFVVHCHVTTAKKANFSIYVYYYSAGISWRSVFDPFLKQPDASINLINTVSASIVMSLSLGRLLQQQPSALVLEHVNTFKYMWACSFVHQAAYLLILNTKQSTILSRQKQQQSPVLWCNNNQSWTLPGAKLSGPYPALWLSAVGFDWAVVIDLKSLWLAACLQSDGQDMPYDCNVVSALEVCIHICASMEGLCQHWHCVADPCTSPVHWYMHASGWHVTISMPHHCPKRTICFFGKSIARQVAIANSLYISRSNGVLGKAGLAVSGCILARLQLMRGTCCVRLAVFSVFRYSESCCQLMTCCKSSRPSPSM